MAAPMLALAVGLAGCSGRIGDGPAGERVDGSAGPFDDASGPIADAGQQDGVGDATPGVDAAPDVDADPATILFALDFDQLPLGLYDSAALDADWAAPSWNQGVDEGRVAIVDGAEAYAGRSLRVSYPEGAVGPGEGGAQWQLALGGAYDELFLSYRVMFGSGFDFVKGGKLPGLVGGEANTGGEPPDGTDGWSARMMWRTGGAVVQYVYYPDQAGTYGDDFPWDAGGARTFVPGQWHRVEHRIAMNTPGVADGLIEGWFDGELALRREGLRFRDVAELAIDGLYFSTFFGGSDSSWAAAADEYVFFDDFAVSTQPIAH